MTEIEITPPLGVTESVNYASCSVNHVGTGKAGDFSISISTFDATLIDRYPMGSDVRINQDGNIFRGWVLNPTSQLDGTFWLIKLDGLCYTGRTQKIMVTEQYINWAISDIVKDLFTKYAPQFNQDSIVSCSKIISIKFQDQFLFDVMEQLATLAGYEFFIDEPVPEQIDTLSLPSGWAELVETFIHLVSYPSETLYPSEYLYPA